MKFKQKKNVRQRGSNNHGWGAKKKHRGKGHRGGKGMAGTGKRADQKKPSIWKDHDYFGKLGFHSLKPKLAAVNTAYLEDRAQSLVAEGKAKAAGGVIEIDLKALGFDKLVSKGIVTKKFKLTVDYASSKAIEKIKKAGGDVVVSVENNTDESA